MKPTKIAFEQKYPDESGVEFAVRYDSSNVDQIEFERVNSVNFPVEELDWLINCLRRIRDDVLGKDDKNE